MQMESQDLMGNSEPKPQICSEKVFWARPDGFGETPGFVFGQPSNCVSGIIILHEWWGLNDEVKGQATKMATEGFCCLLPDLYRGSAASEVDHATHLMNNLVVPGAIHDIRGAARYLLSQGCPKVGLLGFGMGGALALTAAVEVNEVTCAVLFYGTPEPNICDPINCRKPLQAHFGELDPNDLFSSLATAEALRDRLQETGNSDSEVCIYPNTGHSFMNELPSSLERQERMGFVPDNPAAREQAWASLLIFFRKHLVL